mmetsp:Transcript_29709/g.61046  ORF Transcript_29709/g.61046 Transcript_29709/m.61046 type:complete len:372 (-) Transcript_29709:213-1328(-)
MPDTRTSKGAPAGAPALGQESRKEILKRLELEFWTTKDKELFGEVSWKLNQVFPKEVWRCAYPTKQWPSPFGNSLLDNFYLDLHTVGLIYPEIFNIPKEIWSSGSRSAWLPWKVSGDAEIELKLQRTKTLEIQDRITPEEIWNTVALLYGEPRWEAARRSTLPESVGAFINLIKARITNIVSRAKDERPEPFPSFAYAPRTATRAFKASVNRTLAGAGASAGEIEGEVVEEPVQDKQAIKFLQEFLKLDQRCQDLTERVEKKSAERAQLWNKRQQPAKKDRERRAKLARKLEVARGDLHNHAGDVQAFFDSKAIKTHEYRRSPTASPEGKSVAAQPASSEEECDELESGSSSPGPASPRRSSRRKDANASP